LKNAVERHNNLLVGRIVVAVVLELGIYIYNISVLNVVSESQVIIKWEHAWLIFAAVTFYKSSFTDTLKYYGTLNTIE
jgi:hypothetical protein